MLDPKPQLSPNAALLRDQAEWRWAQQLLADARTSVSAAPAAATGAALSAMERAQETGSRRFGCIWMD